MNNFSNLINEVVKKADIVNIIGSYIKLEKKGAGYFGLCPFHDDKNPSLSVSPSKKIFKCFSCNATGDVIKFVEDFKKIPFIEALREVASTVNIPVTVSRAEQEAKKNEKYYKIMDASLKFYNFYLKNTIEGKTALEYLNKRGIDEELIDHFKIGLAPSEQDLLYQSLVKQDYLALDIAEVGLVRLSEFYYDVFRQRIMFPISDLSGHIVGYSGRKYIKTSNEAKYINSNETIIFKKGQILYNYFEASNAIRKQNKLILFEGFMDVFAAYRVGIDYAVASMGTALTLDQIKAMKRLTNNIIICYDADEAGVQASIRAIKMLVNQDLNVEVVSLPEGLDPDDYLTKFGKKELQERLIKAPISGADYIYNEALKVYNPKDINSIEILKTNVFQMLRAFKSNTIHDIYLNKMAELFGVSLNSLYTDFNKVSLVEEVAIPVFVETPKARPKKKIRLRDKYLRIQQELINLAFNYQDKFLQIDDSFNCQYLKEEFREIMNSASPRILNHKVLDINHFANELSEGAKKAYIDIINLEIKPNISKLELYLEEFAKWPYTKASEEAAKETKNANKILEYKRKTISIKRSRD